MKKHVALLIGILLPALTVASAVADEVAPEAKSFTMPTYLEGSSNLVEPGDFRYSRSFSLSLMPALALGSVKLSAVIVGIQETEPVDKAYLKNTDLGIRIPIAKLNSVFSTSLGVATIIPTNEDSRKKDTLVTAGSLRPRLAFSYKRLSGFLDASLTQNVHEYDTSTLTGTENIARTLTPRLNSAVELGAGIGVSIDARYTTAWTYANHASYKFLLAEELSLDVGGGAGIYVSHSNAGNALKNNGTDSNISVFNEENSEIAAGLVMEF